MKRCVVSAVVGLFGLGCTPAGQDSRDDLERSAEVAAALMAQEAPHPIVLTLQTKDHEVAVYSIDGDLRFTVSLHGSGAVLAEQVNEDEFAKAFPGIHQHFRTAFADENCDPDAAGAWAGL